MGWKEKPPGRSDDKVKQAISHLLLESCLNSITTESLESTEREILETIMRRAAPESIHLWGPSLCFPFSAAVLRHFQRNRRDIPSGTGILRVSTKYHSWIEIQTDKNIKRNGIPRGDIVFDATGLAAGSYRNDDFIAHFGKATSAPSHLFVCYFDSPEYTVETVDNRLYVGNNPI